jgi:hypothetical protein
MSFLPIGFPSSNRIVTLMSQRKKISNYFAANHSLKLFLESRKQKKNSIMSMKKLEKIWKKTKMK